MLKHGSGAKLKRHRGHFIPVCRPNIPKRLRTHIVLDKIILFTSLFRVLQNTNFKENKVISLSIGSKAWILRRGI